MALSYLWGADSPKQQAVNGAHLNQTFPVIEDAMKVAKSIGFRFLWVDRYCIDQDNAKEKHTQIRNMHIIYEDAGITIIAGAGEGPEFGLPGVSTPRHPQPKVQIGDYMLVSTLDPRSDIAKSKWNTRAWTYQEALLSRRRLVFTPRQVYFQCRGMHCVESISVPLKHLHTTKLDRFMDEISALQVFPKGSVGKYPSDYRARVQEYRKRSLSYDSDGLNAFMGIASAFQFLKNPTQTIWGIPLFPFQVFQPTMKNRSSVLCSGLASEWHGVYNGLRCHRRPFFPSWSWVGWGHSNGNYSHSRMTWPASLESGPKVLDSFNYDARIKLELNSGSIIDCEADELSGWPAHILEDASVVLQIEAWTMNLILILGQGHEVIPYYAIQREIILSANEVSFDKNLADEPSLHQRLREGQTFLGVILGYQVQNKYQWTYVKAMITEYNEEEMVYERLGFTHTKFRDLFREVDDGVGTCKKSAYATLGSLRLERQMVRLR